jgi:hypothetical protein
VEAAPGRVPEQARVEGIGIGGLDNQSAAGREQLPRLSQHRARIRDVFDEIEHQHHVKCSGDREIFDATFEEGVPRPLGELPRRAIDVDDRRIGDARVGGLDDVEQPAAAAADIQCAQLLPRHDAEHLAEVAPVEALLDALNRGPL